MGARKKADGNRGSVILGFHCFFAISDKSVRASPNGGSPDILGSALFSPGCRAGGGAFPRALYPVHQCAGAFPHGRPAGRVPAKKPLSLAGVYGTAFSPKIPWAGLAPQQASLSPLPYPDAGRGGRPGMDVCRRQALPPARAPGLSGVLQKLPGIFRLDVPVFPALPEGTCPACLNGKAAQTGKIEHPGNLG